MKFHLIVDSLISYSLYFSKLQKHYLKKKYKPDSSDLIDKNRQV